MTMPFTLFREYLVETSALPRYRSFCLAKGLKEMKKYTYVFVLLMTVISGASFADSSIVCDRSLKSSSALFQNALDNIYSFHYVHHAIENIRQTAAPQEVTFCTSSVALNKNIYQYLKHLILIDAFVGNDKTPKYTLRLLFQNASIQAFHNVGGQPWAGLDPVQTQNAFNSLIAGASAWKAIQLPVNTYSALEVATLSATFKKDQTQIDATSLSAIPVSRTGEKEIYLVSWLTKNFDNSYATQVYSHGVLVAFTSGQQVEIAENIFPNGDLLIPLENQLEQTTMDAGANSEWTRKLLKISL